MAMGSPEDNAKATLEQIKNQITLGELEVKRLRGLAAGEEYTLAELVNAKQDHQASIVSAQEQLQQHNNDIKKLNNEINTLSGMLSTGKTVAAKYDKQKAVAIKAMDESNSVLKTNEKRLEKIRAEGIKLEEDIEGREVIIADREKAFEETLNRFNNFIKDLKRI
jgi:chromosome segregation ATPase